MAEAKRPKSLDSSTSDLRDGGGGIFGKVQRIRDLRSEKNSMEEEREKMRSELREEMEKEVRKRIEEERIRSRKDIDEIERSYREKYNQKLERAQKERQAENAKMRSEMENEVKRRIEEEKFREESDERERRYKDRYYQKLEREMKERAQKEKESEGTALDERVLEKIKMLERKIAEVGKSRRRDYSSSDDEEDDSFLRRQYESSAPPAYARNDEMPPEDFKTEVVNSILEKLKGNQPTTPTVEIAPPSNLKKSPEVRGRFIKQALSMFKNNLTAKSNVNDFLHNFSNTCANLNLTENEYTRTLFLVMGPEEKQKVNIATSNRPYELSPAEMHKVVNLVLGKSTTFNEKCKEFYLFKVSPTHCTLTDVLFELASLGHEISASQETINRRLIDLLPIQCKSIVESDFIRFYTMNGQAPSTLEILEMLDSKKQEINRLWSGAVGPKTSKVAMVNTTQNHGKHHNMQATECPLCGGGHMPTLCPIYKAPPSYHACEICKRFTQRDLYHPASLCRNRSSLYHKGNNM